MKRLHRSEVHCLQNATSLIGRTGWDAAVVAALGSTAPYYHCDELIREPFWEGDWRIEAATPSRIFVSQASVPFKGMHILLEALHLLRRTEGDVHVVVAGKDPFTSRGPYAGFLRDLTHRWGLHGAVHRIGDQSPSQMVRHMEDARVFVLASFIENSSNSLAEAMLIGMPCVATFTGGTPDMLTHRFDGLLYQPDAPYMLASAIREVLSQPELSARLGRNARATARERHDARRNSEALLRAYESTLGE
jgi:glycosyltransferase involved in cell wall biosynthesis